MSNKTNPTNTELMAEIAALNSQEVAEMGVSTDLQKMAANYNARSAAALADAVTTSSTMFNAFTGLVTKIAYSHIERATYRDIFRRFHKGYVDGGDVEVAFMLPASEGTGNQAETDVGTVTPVTMTTAVTATAPTMYHITERTFYAAVSRVPISRAMVKTAFVRDSGIADLIEHVRQAGVDAIIRDSNQRIHEKLEELFADTTLIKLVGAGSLTNTTGATYYQISEVENESTIRGLTDADLINIFTAIKATVYGMVGEPTGLYNAMGVANNAPSVERLLCFIDSDLWAAMTTRIAANAFNESELRQAGLEIIPLKSRWLDEETTISGLTSNQHIYALVCSDNYIQDYTTNDESSALPTERGQIISRFANGVIYRVGFEPATFIGATVK